MSELLCRLCLSDYSKDSMHLLTVECDIITKLSFCLSHHIDITPGLPSTICDLCYKMVEDIFMFREKIIKNEYFLQKKLHDPISEVKYKSVAKSANENTRNEDTKNKGHKEKVQITPHLTGDMVKDESDDTKPNKNIDDDISEYLNSEETIFEDIQVSQSDRDYTSVLKTERDLKCNIKSEADNTDYFNSAGALSEDVQVLQQNISNLLENNMCLTCSNSFPSRLELLHHYESEERLKHDTKDTENIKQLKYRMVNLNGNVMYKCEQCNKEYRSQKFIKRHFLTHKDRPFLCKLCGRTYRTAIEIVNHAKVHGGDVFVCSFKCGYSSVHKHVVKDHERRHRNEFKYTCETCGKQFQVKTWYEQHQNIHTGAKPYVCNYCGMAFHLDRYLTQHRNTVHPKEMTQKRYLCIHCSIPCSSKHGLALHLKEHDIDSSLVESLCDECGKVLKNARQLKCHKRIHMDPKPYVCGTCDKTFSKNCNLAVHELSHTDTRFPCDRCTKRFTQRSSLNRHLLRCREFIQKCDKCSQTFYNKRDFMKHNKTCN